MVSLWWSIGAAFVVGGALGGLVCLAFVCFGFAPLLCKRGIPCISTKLHEEPQQVHLSWQGPTDSTMTVTWVTRSKANRDAVQYRREGDSEWSEIAGEARALPRSGLAPAAGVLHRTELRGLEADTRYEYRVSSDTTGKRPWSAVRGFRTAPAEGSFTAAFIADTGQPGRIDGLADGVTGVLAALRKEDPLFILGGGDYAYADRDGRFTDPNLAIDNWFRMMEPVISEIPFMAQYGNHELRLSERLSLWKPRFGHPEGYNDGECYSFDVAGTHFTSLLADGENDLTPDMLAWLDRDLAAARERGCRWLIVYHHESIYGAGRSHPARPEARTVLAPYFLRHGVDLHLSAHDQNLERTFPLRGDPSAPEIASRDPAAYDKGAGVIFAKVSPSGKRSEIGFGFSKLGDEAADFVAVRDDTAHHFAVLSVEPATLEVRVIALDPDTGETRTIDRFRIRS